MSYGISTWVFGITEIFFMLLSMFLSQWIGVKGEINGIYVKISIKMEIMHNLEKNMHTLYSREAI